MRVLMITAALLLAAPAAASACSCVRPQKPRKEIRAADAAVFAKVVQRTVVGAAGPYDFGDELRYRLRVLRDYKRNVPRHITVTGNSNSAMCGLNLRRGQRVGLLLDRNESAYSAGLCSVRSRKHLEAGAKRRRGTASASAAPGCPAAG